MIDGTYLKAHRTASRPRAVKLVDGGANAAGERLSVTPRMPGREPVASKSSNIIGQRGGAHCRIYIAAVVINLCLLRVSNISQFFNETEQSEFLQVLNYALKPL